MLTIVLPELAQAIGLLPASQFSMLHSLSQPRHIESTWRGSSEVYACIEGILTNHTFPSSCSSSRELIHYAGVDVNSLQMHFDSSELEGRELKMQKSGKLDCDRYTSAFLIVYSLAGSISNKLCRGVAKRRPARTGKILLTEQDGYRDPLSPHSAADMVK